MKRALKRRHRYIVLKPKGVLYTHENYDLISVLRKLPSEGRRRIIVSTYHRSVALKVTDEPQNDVLDLLQMQHLFSCNDSTDSQPAVQVVKISGNITVSF